jgi:hypothetical protein
MKGSLVTPPSVLPKVKEIAGFQPQDDGWGEYPLDEKQTGQITKILGFRSEVDRFYYYVEPCDPPEDNGFREPTLSASHRAT